MSKIKRFLAIILMFGMIFSSSGVYAADYEKAAAELPLVKTYNEKLDNSYFTVVITNLVGDYEEAYAYFDITVDSDINDSKDADWILHSVDVTCAPYENVEDMDHYFTETIKVTRDDKDENLYHGVVLVPSNYVCGGHNIAVRLEGFTFRDTYNRYSPMTKNDIFTFWIEGVVKTGKLVSLHYNMLVSFPYEGYELALNFCQFLKKETDIGFVYECESKEYQSNKDNLDTMYINLANEAILVVDGVEYNTILPTYTYYESGLDGLPGQLTFPTVNYDGAREIVLKFGGNSIVLKGKDALIPVYNSGTGAIYSDEEVANQNDYKEVIASDTPYPSWIPESDIEFLLSIGWNPNDIRKLVVYNGEGTDIDCHVLTRKDGRTVMNKVR